MLLSIDDHTKLLTIPWTRFDNTISTINTGDSNITGPLYIKTLFDQDTYRVLVTDLHYVWYELGDAPSITKTAASHRLEITCKEQVNILITSIRRCFLHSENCHVRLIPSGQLLIDYKETNKGFSSLSWTFHCTPLDTVLVSGDNHGYLDGPTVLYKHFISPLVALNQSNWLNTKIGKDEEEMTTVSPSLKVDDTSGIEDNWLSQLSYITAKQANDKVLSTKTDPQEKEQDTKDNDTAIPKFSTTSGSTKKLTDPDEEMERRTKLESDLLKKKELKKKKRRLF